MTSPTFTLAHTYRTTPPVTHVDLWRLEHLQEVVDLALEEELDEGGVVVVEWGEAAEPLYGADALVVRLDWGAADDERSIAIEARGASLEPRGPRGCAKLLGRSGTARRGMRILAIETATIEVGVAVADETGPLATVTARPGRRQAETLHPAIADVCRIAGITPAELDAVAVDIGPGLFTGLRVGVAAAKALAGALGLPVVTATSLEVLAAACPSARRCRRARHRHAPRRGRLADAGKAPATFASGAPAELAAELTALAALAGAGPVLLVGDGALRYRELLGRAPGPPGASSPEPSWPLLR